MTFLPPADLRTQLAALHRESFVWALRCCAGMPARAEDVLQDSYLKILDGRARFGGRSSFKTWLLALIRFTALDETRKFARHRARLADLEEAPEQCTESVDVTLMREEYHGDLRTALATLPLRQQEALTLVFYHDLSISEAADVMGVTLGTARTHYERAKKQLRESITSKPALP